MSEAGFLEAHIRDTGFYEDGCHRDDLDYTDQDLGIKWTTSSRFEG